MEYRTLGRTALEVSAIGIGAWQLSGPLTLDGKDDGFPDVGQDEVIRLIHGCEDLGINFIDAAEIYGAGEGERRAGQALQGRREKWIISSKFGLRQGVRGERIVDVSPHTIQTSLEGSLKRLQTDYVDIYLFHAPPNQLLIDESKAVLDNLKQQGKLRFYGISTNDENILRQLAESSSVDVVMFSQSLVTYLPEVLNIIKQYNLGGLVRGALQGGLLSGKYFHTKPSLAQEDIRRSWMSTLRTEKYSVLEKYIPEGSSMVALALRYLLDFDTTHTIVLGGKSLEDYQAALRALDLPPLEPETKAALETLRHKLQGFYWRSQFKQKAVAKLKKLLVR
ncbi:aldo/keto reductase [Leptolyngbya sp. AN02str]|uniref:aldo/keto reductase n=1 Tax=Leptolyngbya sp. AN02str TaxID=3423363 RepID=UPI003D318E03